MKSKTGPIRALVIDDSLTARELLVAILQVAEGIQVIGVGVDGHDAVRLTRRMRPDVLVMDITMPKLGGLEATRQIMSETPTPIVLVTGSLMRSDVDLSFEALRAGALTVMQKPGLADPDACDALVKTVHNMSGVPLVRRWRTNESGVVLPAGESLAQMKAAPQFARPPRATLLASELNRPFRVIGVAASTGGPGTLATLLRDLPPHFPIPILVVQHVTPGFASGLAEWLDTQTPLRVKLAAHGAELEPGTVLIAPDSYHMQLNFQGVIELSKEPPYKGLRPSANYLFDSLARVFGPRALGIILTGMGDDGAEGMLALHQSGGMTLAQDEQSSVIYGMPREAVLRNAVDAIMPPEEMTAALLQLMS